jgi:dihydroorotase
VETLYYFSGLNAGFGNILTQQKPGTKKHNYYLISFSMTILIRGAKMIDALSPHHLKTVDIFIENGVIHSIGDLGSKAADQVIAAAGLHVSSGWTDIFADYCEPGFEHKETIVSGLAAAAAGGFTKVFTTPNTYPAVSTKAVVQYLLRQAEGHAVSLHPVGSVSANIEGKNLAEMLDMQAHGAIAFSDGWKPVQNANLMLKALEYVKAFDGVIIQLPGDSALADGGLMHEGIESTRLGMPGIPTLAETIHLHRDIELLRYTGSRLHITGVSAAASVEMIRRAKQEGLNISCSVTPYHLALNDEILATYDAAYKVNPPIRSEADRLALIEGIKDGTIDCITSHHHPQDWDAKTKEFEYAANGMNVQETAFAIACSALLHHVSLEQVVAAFSSRPAAIFGLPRGVQEGQSADLTLFVTGGSFRTGKVQSKARNNPFSEQEFPATVLGIIHNNKVILNAS